MREWIVAGNWKMHNTIQESVALAKAIVEGVKAIKKGEVVLAPPFTALYSVCANHQRFTRNRLLRKICIMKIREHIPEK